MEDHALAVRGRTRLFLASLVTVGTFIYYLLVLEVICWLFLPAGSPDRKRLLEFALAAFATCFLGTFLRRGPVVASLAVAVGLVAAFVASCFEPAIVGAIMGVCALTNVIKGATLDCCLLGSYEPTGQQRRRAEIGYVAIILVEGLAVVGGSISLETS